MKLEEMETKLEELTFKIQELTVQRNELKKKIAVRKSLEATLDKTTLSADKKKEVIKAFETD